MMTKLLIGLLGAGVIATGGYAAASGVDADPARTVSLPAATTEATTATDTVEDVSGPCDEAEHRNDPRCTGASSPAAPAPAAAAATTTADDRGDDNVGDDHRGRDHDGDDDSGHRSGGGDDDRSGSNSGKG